MEWEGWTFFQLGSKESISKGRYVRGMKKNQFGKQQRGDSRPRKCYTQRLRRKEGLSVL